MDARRTSPRTRCAGRGAGTGHDDDVADTRINASRANPDSGAAQAGVQRVPNEGDATAVARYRDLLSRIGRAIKLEREEVGEQIPAELQDVRRTNVDT